ncbi:MAG TPA: hypothetical protein VMJ73_08470 [Rhizomicrobium sp.]|nr:hypothetical protein [Rhizomicrobium sp.]
MRTQFALATAGAAPARSTATSASLGALVMLTMLSPMFAVCGFMLAQILGYSPF